MPKSPLGYTDHFDDEYRNITVECQYNEILGTSEINLL